MNLLQNRLKQAEFARTVWSATPEPGTTLEQMMKPEYWAHVAKLLKPGCRIEVTPADGSWFAELYVRSGDANSLRVAVLWHVVFSETKPEVVSSFDVKHRGAKGWCVVRKSDKAITFENGGTQGDAENWIKGNSLA